MNDMPELPDFLRVPQEQRNASWRGRKLTRIKPPSVTRLQNEDASTRAFRREIEKQKKAKQAERFALLRERAAEMKRRAVRA